MGKNRSFFCRQNTLQNEELLLHTVWVPVATVFLSLTHTPIITYPKVFLDVSVLTRTEGDETEPLIKRQGQSEMSSQIWSQEPLGSLYFIKDGGQNRGPHAACGLTLTNQTWQSPSLPFFCASSHVSPLPSHSPLFSLLLSALHSVLRHCGGDGNWPARAKALSYPGRWWGWRENQISQGRSLALNFSIHLGESYTYWEKATDGHRTQGAC